MKVQYHTCLILFLQDVKLLLEDIAELKPTIFCAVPRVLDRIYTGELSLLAKRANGFDLSVFLSMWEVIKRFNISVRKMPFCCVHHFLAGALNCTFYLLILSFLL